MGSDLSVGRDSALVGVEHALKETGFWDCNWELWKHVEDIDGLAPDGLPWRGREHEFFGLYVPAEVVAFEGNILVNAGINLMWNLICAAGGTAFNNANAAIGVGDSSTAEAASQTNLQAGTNAARAGMNGGFPTSGTSQQAQFQSSFGSGVANFVWNEWGVFNAVGSGGPPTGGTMMNRKVQALGTKAGGTWTLTVTITLS